MKTNRELRSEKDERMQHDPISDDPTKKYIDNHFKRRSRDGFDDDEPDPEQGKGCLIFGLAILVVVILLSLFLAHKRTMYLKMPQQQHNTYKDESTPGHCK
jgi:hypothetical protein